jgi:hypothetical protein
MILPVNENGEPRVAIQFKANDLRIRHDFFGEFYQVRMTILVIFDPNENSHNRVV